MSNHPRFFAATLVALALVAAACGGSDEPAVGTGDDGDVVEFETVNVEVTEFSVTPNPTSTVAGPVAFGVRNAGGIIHEFVVIRTDLAADELPVEGSAVDETAEGITVIDEIESIPTGGSVVLQTELEAGAYVLICNVSTHYESGMHAAFEVT